MPGMDGQQPPTYAHYPRPGSQQDPDKLMLLYKAYTGIYWLILSTIGIAIVTNVVAYAIVIGGGRDNVPLAGMVNLACLGALFVGNFFVCYKYAKMLGEAKSKDAGYALGVALLATLFSPCCIGIGGCVVIQQIASNEFKLYGIPAGFMGVKKADIEAKVAALRQFRQSPPPPTV